VRGLTDSARLQKLIVSGVGGKDQFTFRITQLREHPSFRDFRETVTFSHPSSSDEDDELPNLWFDLGFVEFLKDNYSRIQRSLDRLPESFDEKTVVVQSTSLGSLADAVDGVGVGGGEGEGKYVRSLEIRLKSMEGDVKSKDAEIQTLKTKLEKQVRVWSNGIDSSPRIMRKLLWR
jgi:intracellular protein transport protein USO1